MTIIDFGIKFHFIALLLLHTINTDIIKLKRTKKYIRPIAFSLTPFRQTHVVAVPIDSSYCERVYFAVTCKDSSLHCCMAVEINLSFKQKKKKN